MAGDRSIRRLRRAYAALLRLYPKPFRERFAEPMEQTFHDLVRERVDDNKPVFGLACWIIVETFARICQENAAMILTASNFARPTVITLFVLVVPLIGTLVSDEWNWAIPDFIVAGVLVFGTCFGYQLLARNASRAYRGASGMALATALLLIWVNGAVGLIGDGPINLVYFAVLIIGVAGSLVARFEPMGMSRALFATAIMTALVPVIALAVGTSDFAPGVAVVFVLNTFFVLLFVGAGLLFRGAVTSTDR